LAAIIVVAVVDDDDDDWTWGLARVLKDSPTPTGHGWDKPWCK